MRNKHCLIILNSDQLPQHCADMAQRAGYVIATDGAWQHCRDLGISPDIVLGDMDSITNADELSETALLQIADQETTDAEKALLHAQQQGARHIHLAGILGDRLDHSLYHINLMKRFHNSFERITGYSNTEYCYIAQETEQVSGTPGQRISLINQSSQPILMTTTGLHWPVTTLAGNRHAVSNRFTQPCVHIQTNAAAALLVIVGYGDGDGYSEMDRLFS